MLKSGVCDLVLLLQVTLVLCVHGWVLFPVLEHLHRHLVLFICVCVGFLFLHFLYLFICSYLYVAGVHQALGLSA